MGTLNKKEKELLSEIVESIEDELTAISEGFANNDRLAYLTCLTDNEKVEYTKQEIKKLQGGFKVCNPDISEYIFALIQKHPSDNSTQAENQKQIIENFILGEYSETFDLLIKTGKGNTLFENTFKELITGLNHETKLLDEFINNVANANRYLELVELLNDTSHLPLKNNTEIQHIGQIRKVEKIDIDELIRWLMNNMKGEVETFISQLPGGSLANEKIKDYIIDTYGWQEKIIIEHHIQTYKVLLTVSSKHKKVNSRLNNLRNEIESSLATYENKLSDFNKKNHFPKTTFQEISNLINNAFFRLESYMNGGVKNYKYYGYNDAFSILFNEAQKPENFTYENCKLIGQYWQLTEQLRIDYDQSDFENQDAWENEDFCKDRNEIEFLNYDRIEDFNLFITPDEIAETEKKFSITDIYKYSLTQATPQPNENPNPAIFTSPKGFKIFTRFKEQIPFIESPNSEYADYSFLFNSLKKDKFIHDVKHKTFIEFLDKQYKVEFAKTYNQFKFSITRQKKDAYATCKLQFH